MDVTIAVSDVALSTTTCCFLSVKNEFIHVLVFPSIPLYLSLRERRLCETLSKALEKSNIAMSTCLPEFRDLEISSVVIKS